jgi:ABC-2 type transport system permease protein
MAVNIIRNWLSSTNKLERFWLLAKIEFKLRYYENLLGLLWALVKPLCDITIYYIAFEIILKQGVSQYISFLFIGIVLWNFFVESTSGTVQILSTKKYLYEYTNMNKIEIYLSVIGSNLIGLFFNLIIFVFFYLLLEKGDTHFSWHIIFFFPILLNLIILALAFSLIISTIYIYAKDINQIWAIVINLAFWVSPLVYAPAVFLKNMAIVAYLNPFASILLNARNVILYHHMPDWTLFGWGYIYSIFFLLIGVFLLNKIGSKAAEKL